MPANQQSMLCLDVFDVLRNAENNLSVSRIGMGNLDNSWSSLLMKAMVDYYVYLSLLFHSCNTAGMLPYSKKVTLYHFYFTTKYTQT